ncbi:16S rRNA (cytidine1402-2'-O)-methyltransferase [Humidesulfovibrio mexicanus]|uniref:Ribosomal RNA small subunit methyltransferase I n=1 Tax=Humidesulfovibrio mexicanus TaxID=147047 RepID=A0A239ANK2_9BACT|nr:16S rRNA (cytidine(1402)-2'-O)-methyltransferase [Humidesulfovibrio mexicanus]SNR96553.1 16S rRNA (cytidine1402-2'-O)-methyltransferase [Humidesulfovibrio mexicanus]
MDQALDASAPDELAPGLYLVATPIGNAGDLSPRAAEVLRRAGVVLAEDTRRAGLFFRRQDLAREAGRKGFMSLHEHNEAGRIPQVMELIQAGQSVALISDAGTPVLSDPGYRLVRACRLAGLPVASLPGPFAPAVALSACGLPPAPFTFLGFLPRHKGQAQRLLSRHAATGASLVFFERKDRLAETLALAAGVLGDREFAVCRELTKQYEEFILGRLGRLDEARLGVLGEVTVVIGPEALAPVPGAASASPSAQGVEAGTGPDLEAVLAEEKARGGKPREVARRVVERLGGAAPGRTVKDVYDLLKR